MPSHRSGCPDVVADILEDYDHARSEGVYAERELWTARTARVWTDWFEGLVITLEANRDTLLTGLVVDQAALHGVLKNVRDLGLPLLSVMHVEPVPAARPESMQPRR